MENQLNEPKEITVTDFSDFKTTPLRLVGKDGMVYWKDCPSVTLAREKEDHGKMINLRTGEMRLAKDYVLILIGDGGLGKQ
ncbi:hypothetical protein ED733_002338 [Metarhizium rileyi]|uniref:Uncharacterized protein n=1 Tax=Metarhizium rileyi (strain RCEF 4871) TaxID=1649241 RepID=A0A5C6G642_METRR|nr:hypothetical protein ED733_002338 [Metarhizium rileyi]